MMIPGCDSDFYCRASAAVSVSQCHRLSAVVNTVCSWRCSWCRYQCSCKCAIERHDIFRLSLSGVYKWHCHWNSYSKIISIGPTLFLKMLMLFICYHQLLGTPNKTPVLAQECAVWSEPTWYLSFCDLLLQRRTNSMICVSSLASSWTKWYDSWRTSLHSHSVTHQGI